MLFKELVKFVEDNKYNVSDTDVVMVMDKESVLMYDIADIGVESVQYDSEGNQISVGGTVWINVVEH